MPGPHVIRERNPLFALFPTPTAETAEVTRGWRLEFDAGFSNIFERQINETHFQDLDFEQTAMVLTPRVGLPGGWELGADIGLRQRGGGFLDSAIQEFHSAFGLPNDSREDVPDGRYSFLFSHANGDILLSDTAGRLDDLTFFVKYRLPGSQSVPLAVKLATRVDSSSYGDQAGTGGDVSLQLFTQGMKDRWGWYVSGGMVFLNANPALARIVQDTAVVGSATLLRQTKYGFALSAQLDGGTSYFKGTGLSNLDDPPVNFSVAVSGMGKKLGWRVYFAEDLTGGGPAVDFTLGVNATFNFASGL